MLSTRMLALRAACPRIAFVSRARRSSNVSRRKQESDAVSNQRQVGEIAKSEAAAKPVVVAKRVLTDDEIKEKLAAAFGDPTQAEIEFIDGVQSGLKRNVSKNMFRLI